MPKSIGMKIVVMTLAAVMVSGGVRAQNAKSKSTTPKITLHEQAKKGNGKFISKYKANRGTIYPNIQELAKRSDLVIVGRVLSHKSSLTPDERFITQDFLVKVNEVIKGDLLRGRSVLVTLPGGRHMFRDGAYAAIMPVGYKEPEDKGLYVFFLKSRKKDSAFKGQRLLSERQGMFALTKGTVEPAELAPDDPMNVKYRGMGAPLFLEQIHKAVPRKKK